jgi:D-arabinose 5-phosphate isomerase GutQ
MSPIPDKIMPITPPAGRNQRALFDTRLNTAVHVLSTEAKALLCLTQLYQTDSVAREGFDQAVEAIRQCMDQRGKIVICGVGKSGHIAKKLVATMNSLRVPSTFLHPTEALHGDLGKVGECDVILLISFSGKTPELLSLIPHFDKRLPLMIITSHTHPSTCAIAEQRPDIILLPAPIHEPESESFGVSAPTTSTTIALALGDALAVAISAEMHPSVSDVFSRNHPGGAIGQAARGPGKISSISTALVDIPFVGEGWGSTPKAMHVILRAYQSVSGWVKYSDGSVVPPRRIRRLAPEDMEKIATKIHGLVVPAREWINVPGNWDVLDVIAFVKSGRESQHLGEEDFADDAILAITVDGAITGVVEIAELLALA